MTDGKSDDLGRKVRLSLFSRNFARGMGTMCGYGMGIAIVLVIYKLLGIIPFDWIRAP